MDEYISLKAATKRIAELEADHDERMTEIFQDHVRIGELADQNRNLREMVGKLGVHHEELKLAQGRIAELESFVTRFVFSIGYGARPAQEPLSVWVGELQEEGKKLLEKGKQ